MTILQYYLRQQQIETWKKKFTSTSSSQSGKLYSYYTTNMKKGIPSLPTQYLSFLPKINIDRFLWNDNMKSGQEVDKHRITTLTNTGFIQPNGTKYVFTYKSSAMTDICQSELRACEQWFLMFLLILDFNFENRQLDLLKTTKETFALWNSCEISDGYIMSLLKPALRFNKRKQLFLSDIFWLVTFVRDHDFITIYFNSTDNEKESLHNYVLNCNDNPDSTDLIAYKFHSGVVLPNGFVDGLKFLYYSKIFLDNIAQDFDSIIDILINMYCDDFILARKEIIEEFIKNHKSVYNVIYKRVKECFLCH